VALTKVVSLASPAAGGRDLLRFTTDPRTKFVPITVIVNVGPPVATIEGMIVVMVGITPIPASGTSIFPIPGFENVISRVAFSTAGSEAVNVMPNAHEVNEASENPAPRLQVGVGLTADEGAPSLKSAELADGRMAILVTFRSVNPLPTLNSVPSASEATPFGTLPKDMGLGKHPVTEQEPRKSLVPRLTEKEGIGPLTVPERKSCGSVSTPESPSETVSVANRPPAGAETGGLKVMPKEQVPFVGIAVPVPLVIKPQIGTPEVGVTSMKSPAFVPLIVAEPAFRLSVAPPIFVRVQFKTGLVVPAF